MFWRKEQPADWPLIFFGLIALGIVVSTAVLIVLVRSRATQANLSGVLPTAPLSFLNEQYYKEMEGLVKTASFGDKDLSDVFAKVEDKLLNVRVPAEMRDKHLTALFKIMELEKKNKNTEEADIKNEMMKVLENLTISHKP